MEWFVEKAVEIGIERICFIQCKHAERKSVNLDRIKKKAISALKQSGQAWLPLLEDIQPMTSILKGDGQKYIAHVDPSNTKLLKDAAPASAYRVLIGPEGDFTQEEVEQAAKAGFVKVSLGPNTLRTETAALVACHTLNLINQ